MAVPDPKWDKTDCVWRLDLREPWKLGRHVIHGEPPPAGKIPALHAAYAMLARLQAARPPQAQCELPGTAGRTVGQLLEEYTAQRKYRSLGNRKSVEATAARIRRELGHVPLVALTRAVLAEWRDTVRAGYVRTYPGGAAVAVNVGCKAMRERVSVLRRALKLAVEQGYLASVPPLPDPKLGDDEQFFCPGVAWVDEATFLAVRDSIYLGPMGTSALEGHWRKGGLPWPGCTLEDYIARRRLYLSFALYTGLRRHDLDLLSDLSVAPAFGVYYRTSHKTHLVRGVPERMPPPLAEHIQRELDRRKLLAFPPGDLICGGPWHRVTRVLAVACRHVGVPPFDLRVLRRSFAYHKAADGVAKDKLKDLMSHSTSAMLDHVYAQIPDAGTRDDAGARWPELRTRAAGAARILPISVAAGVAKVPPKVLRDGTEAHRDTAKKARLSRPKAGTE